MKPFLTYSTEMKRQMLTRNYLGKQPVAWTEVRTQSPLYAQVSAHWFQLAEDRPGPATVFCLTGGKK